MLWKGNRYQPAVITHLTSWNPAPLSDGTSRWRPVKWVSTCNNTPSVLLNGLGHAVQCGIDGYSKQCLGESATLSTNCRILHRRIFIVSDT